MGFLNKVVEPLLEGFEKTKPKDVLIPTIKETPVYSFRKELPNLFEEEKPKTGDILPSSREVDEFELRRLQEVKELNANKSSLKIGRNPYYFAKQYGIGVKGTEYGVGFDETYGSYLYNGKIFNKDIPTINVS